MSLSHTYTMTVTDSNGTLSTTSPVVVTGDAEETFSVVSPNASFVDLAMTIDVSTIVAWWMVSDQDVTFLENAADLTFLLSANVPFFWYSSTPSGFGSNQLTVDMTTMKFTNAGGTDANVTGAFLTLTP